MSFSDRMELSPKRTIQIKTIDNRLRNRLYNFYDKWLQNKVIDNDLNEFILDKMGIKIGDKLSNFKKIEALIYDPYNWYYSYDVLEYALEYIYMKDPFDQRGFFNEYVKELNIILAEEKSGYRIIDRQFVPIVDDEELKEIQNALHSEFDAVDQHIQKALMHYSDRDNPDYENSIKESISAVESMCCIISGMSGANATLGAAIKKLEENGVKIHPAMKSAFSQLYGYTSDQNGIRHGGIDFVNAPEEDARYMLVSCSAFVNYLKDKYSKSQNGI